ncbi:hypothetical protein PR048_026300 [Dryococelus australis]|uniref:Uncharacterized protein n=1 Tax=Dryococelus australis TaxID=614101 RepID=A0ABQ9GKY6_9NEOP|nr:hypothetical protein PR048_026300 [Dryococelus australis]
MLISHTSITRPRRFLRYSNQIHNISIACDDEKDRRTRYARSPLISIVAQHFPPTEAIVTKFITCPTFPTHRSYAHQIHITGIAPDIEQDSEFNYALRVPISLEVGPGWRRVNCISGGRLRRRAGNGGKDIFDYKLSTVKRALLKALLKICLYARWVYFRLMVDFKSAHFIVNRLQLVCHTASDAECQWEFSSLQMLEVPPPCGHFARSRPRVGRGGGVTNRVRFPAGSLPDFRVWESCRTVSLVGVLFSEISRFPRPCIPALLHTHLASPLVSSRDLDVKERPKHLQSNLAHSPLVTACMTKRSEQVTKIHNGNQSRCIKSIHTRGGARRVGWAARIGLSSTQPVIVKGRGQLLDLVRRCPTSGRTYAASTIMYRQSRRVLSPAGSPPYFRMWESCLTIPLVGGFSRGSPVLPALTFRLCSTLTSLRPHSALKTSMLKAAQISSLTRPLGKTLICQTEAQKCGMNRLLVGNSCVFTVSIMSHVKLAVVWDARLLPNLVLCEYHRHRRNQEFINMDCRLDLILMIESTNTVQTGWRNGNSLNSHLGGNGFDSRFGNPDFGFPKSLQANAGMYPQQRPWPNPSLICAICTAVDETVSIVPRSCGVVGKDATYCSKGHGFEPKVPLTLVQLLPLPFSQWKYPTSYLIEKLLATAFCAFSVLKTASRG